MCKSIKVIFFCLSVLILLELLCKNIIYKNTSISEPLGYYLAVPFLPVKKGDLVLTCITNTVYKHVFTELGMKDVTRECRNGMMYLLKDIVGQKGDRIEISAKGVLVNGVWIENSQQFDRGRGVDLYPLPVGYHYTLGDNEYFMLGKSLHSVDSRYFGVVHKKDIYRRAFLIYSTGK